ncbi:MAG TPA: Gfo/Idh/MocA family oxidoreductase [Thermoclostridium sp.]
MKKYKLALIGAGSRGTAYANYTVKNPDKFEIVAVAEPHDVRRNSAKTRYNIPDEMCFKDYNEFFKMPKCADVVMICTLDDLHYDPAMKAIDKGYDILLEKPIAPTPEECIAITKAANEKGVNVLVCHVLRYTPFYRKLKDILDDGIIGEIINIIHCEAVGNIHYSHSYVRGNWRNTTVGAPMLLAKSCHDIDLLQWLIGKKCTKVQSFGALTHFTPENQPEGAPDRCTDGCRYSDSCYYYAPKLYLEKHKGWFDYAATKIKNPTDEQILEALRTTSYGKCVYKSDNNVVDHQVVNMQFEDNCTVSFTMSAFNKGGRNMRIMGTKGEIWADLTEDYIKIYDFKTQNTNIINVYEKNVDGTISGGHGGGDTGIMNDLYEFLSGTYNGKSIAEINVSNDNHLIVFAAEKSRLENIVVDFEEYKKSLMP